MRSRRTTVARDRSAPGRPSSTTQRASAKIVLQVDTKMVRSTLTLLKMARTLRQHIQLIACVAPVLMAKARRVNLGERMSAKICVKRGFMEKKSATSVPRGPMVEVLSVCLAAFSSTPPR